MSSDSDNARSVRIKREPSESPQRTTTINNNNRTSKSALKRSSTANNTATDKSDQIAAANATLLRRTGFAHQKPISELLDQRPDLQLVDASLAQPTLAADDVLAADEEIWMFQCARNVNVDQLLGTKLSLNGQRKTLRMIGDGAVEYQSELSATGGACARALTVVCRPRGSRKHEMVTFRPVGTVRVHEEIQETLIADFGRAKQVLVPYPSGLKVRHPLHGSDYAQHTDLNDDVRRKLRSAVRDSELAKREPLPEDVSEVAIVAVKQERTRTVKEERITGGEENGDASTRKSIAGKKRKSMATKVEPEDEDAEVVAPKKAKRVKKEKSVKQETVEEDEEPGTNLDWLSAI